ncbi:MAG: hypothetical protein KAT15_07090, partial [Bacteroidales bacterium]|nr:hypothetical protein [Bacteroidales bacterium]
MMIKRQLFYFLVFATILSSTACRRSTGYEPDHSDDQPYKDPLSGYSIKRFPYLDTEWFRVFVSDNEGKGPHWSGGYNGISALIPHDSGINIFNPYFAGLNYETIELSGTEGELFEPRRNQMSITEWTSEKVVLEQPETPASHVSARITFRVEDPWYVYQTIELTFHRSSPASGVPTEFSSLFASYMHLPVDNHLYLRMDDSGENPLSGWVGVTKENHNSEQYIVRQLPGNEELDPVGHLEAMNHGESSSEMMGMKGPLPFYYGLLYDGLVFLQMFKQPEHVELAYSPTGGFHGDRGDGSGQAWSPAWDYILHLDDV